MAETQTTPAETTETKTEAPAQDPYIKSLLDSFGKVLEPDPVEEEPKEVPAITLGEAVVRTQGDTPPKKTEEKPDGEKSPDAASVKPEEGKKAEEQKKEESAKTETPVNQEKPKEDSRPAIKLKRKPQVQTPTQVQPDKPADDQSKLDEEFDKTLNDEQQEVLTLAKYSDKAKPGILKQTREYFRKVNEFIEKNPNIEADGEEMTQFINTHKPKWSEAEQRRAEREMIAEEARLQVRKELEPDIEATRRRFREMDAKPLVESAIRSVEDFITAKPPREDQQPIDKSVVTAIREKGYDAALKEYPVEAPIVMGTLNATRAWLELSNNVVPFDENNPVHAWLAQFIVDQGNNIRRLPKDQQIFDGKQFLPLHDYTNLRRKDPAAAANFCTFSDEMVVEMLATNTVNAVNGKLKELESAGFKRESKKVLSEQKPKQEATETTKPTTTSTATASPRAGGTSLPGASEGSGKPNPNASFLDTIYPGASKIVGE